MSEQRDRPPLDLTRMPSQKYGGMINLAGKDYFTIPEAAAYCCVSVSHFRQNVKATGLLPGRLWGKFVYRRIDLARLVEEQIQWPQSIGAESAPISTGRKTLIRSDSPLDRFRKPTRSGRSVR